MSWDRRVWKNETLISDLEHGFTWASDDDINERLLLKYRNFDFLTSNDNANTYMLENVIAEWHEYIDELYATTQYEYDPLLNYDMREEGKIIDALHKGHKISSNTNRTITETPRVRHEEEITGYGLGSSADGTPTEKRVNEDKTGTNETTTNGLAANNYDTVTDIDANTYDKNVREYDQYRRYGNLGVTKAQDMVQAQRDIIIDVIDIYISKFKDCFTISKYIGIEPFEEVTP